MYRDVVGSAAWDALPRVLHDLHERGGDGTFTVTSRGIARVFSALGFAPSAGTVPLSLRLEKLDGGGERWIRSFRGEVFATEQRLVQGAISEKYGIIDMRFKVVARGVTLHYEVLEIRLFGLRLPKWMVPPAEASERADGPRVIVSVSIGKSFRYTGMLTPPALAGTR
jgi:hypothetical protein